MKKIGKLFWLSLVLLLILTGCGSTEEEPLLSPSPVVTATPAPVKEVDEETLQADVEKIVQKELDSEEMEVSFEVIKRKSLESQKTETVYIHGIGKNKTYEIARNYALEYTQYNTGWELDSYQPYEDMSGKFEEYIRPTAAPAPEEVKKQLQSVDFTGGSVFSPGLVSTALGEVQKTFWKEGETTARYEVELTYHHNYLDELTTAYATFQFGEDGTWSLSEEAYANRNREEHRFVFNDGILGVWKGSLGTGGGWNGYSYVSMTIDSYDGATCHMAEESDTIRKAPGDPSEDEIYTVTDQTLFLSNGSDREEYQKGYVTFPDVVVKYLYWQGEQKIPKADYFCLNPSGEGLDGYILGESYGGDSTMMTGTLQKEEDAAPGGANSGLPGGQCGDGVSWQFDPDTGELTISGEGPMESYHSNHMSVEMDNPWSEYRDAVKKITVNPGVTFLGKSAFAFCANAVEVSIPNTVTGIGPYAFLSCGSLSTITIPEGVEGIESMAFTNCAALEKVVIPSTVTSMGKDVFERCPNVTIVGEANSYAETYAREFSIPFSTIN